MCSMTTNTSLDENILTLTSVVEMFLQRVRACEASLIPSELCGIINANVFVLFDYLFIPLISFNSVF